MNNKRKLRYFQFAKALHKLYINNFIKTGNEKYRKIIIKHMTWMDEKDIDDWRKIVND